MTDSRKRAGQIIAKGPQKYLVRVFVARDGSGKRQYISKLVHGGKKAADAALAKMLNDKSTGGLTPRTKRTLDEARGGCLARSAQPSVRARRRGEDRSPLKRSVRAYLGPVRLAQPDAGAVRGMLGQLAGSKLSARTQHMAGEVLRIAR